MKNRDKKKRKGIILPVVLIFFSFLMLLGVTFVSVGGFQAIQSNGQRDRLQAEYLAKSGAETFAEFISAEVEKLNSAKKIDDANAFILSLFENTQGYEIKDFLNNEVGIFSDKDSIKITISEIGEFEGIEIHSLVSYREVETSIKYKLEIIESEDTKTVLVPGESSKVIIRVQSFTDINGNILSDTELFDSHITGSGEIKETDVDYRDYSDFPVIKIPSQADYRINLVDNKYDISQDTFEYVTLIAKELKITDNFMFTKKMNQEQKLVIYVSDKITFEKDTKNDSSNYSYKDLIIILGENAVIDYGSNNNHSFKGILYAPHIDFEFKNNADFEGVVVANKFYIKNNGDAAMMIVANHIEYNNNLKLFDLDETITIPTNSETVSDEKIEVKSIQNPWTR